MLAALAPTPLAKRERRKDARPGELLDAALDLFVEKGFAATRAEEVAQRAGVSKGTLFLYFSSKEELFKEVVRRNISGRLLEWNAQFEAFEGSSADLLRLCMREWWTRLGATRASGITKLMIGEARNFPELAAFYQQEVIEPEQLLIRRILQRGVDRGEFAPIDPKHGAYVVMAPLIFLQVWQHAQGACAGAGAAFRLEPDQYLEVLLQTMLHGLCASAAPTKRRRGRS